MLFNRKRSITADPLDRSVLRWGPSDPLTLRNLLDGGICVFGGSGSGKTSGSGAALAHATVSLPHSGGLICAAKPEDAAMWQRIFDAHGRASDLLIFDPENDLRFNFLAGEMQAGGHTRNIAQLMLTIGETLGRGEGGHEEDGKFWRASQRRFLEHAIEIVKQATGEVTAPSLQKFYATAANHPEQLRSEAWQQGFHNQCLKQAYDRPKNAREEADYQAAVDFWLAEFPAMADKTRTSVMAMVMNLLHIFNGGVIRELVSGTTNVSPDDLLRGKWVLVNMPPAIWHDLGRFVNSGWKLMVQRRVLAREVRPGDPVVIIWADEAQDLITSTDTPYLAQCRSHLGCMVYLAQSLPAYDAALGGKDGEKSVRALLSNFKHKIAHALGDRDTAEFFSELVGKSRQIFIGGSSAPSKSVYDELFGTSEFTGTFNEQTEYVLHPNVFMHGLRTGGAAAGGIVDGIVIRSGRPFSTGQNFLKVSFKQE
jgi:hypothetical protein